MMMAAKLALGAAAISSIMVMAARRDVGEVEVALQADVAEPAFAKADRLPLIVVPQRPDDAAMAHALKAATGKPVEAKAESRSGVRHSDVCGARGRKYYRHGRSWRCRR